MTDTAAIAAASTAALAAALAAAPISIALHRRCQVLSQSRLFASLDPTDCQALARLSSERHVARHELVVSRGSRDGSLLVLVEGRLRVGTVSADGREVGHALLEPGSVLGELALLDGQPRSADVTALTDSIVLVLERRGFLPFLMARPAMMLKLMAVLCERVRTSSGAYQALALSPLSSRLAQLLLTLARDVTPTAEGIVVPGKLSQREMALQVAATRERVNKQLRAWQAAGVLGATRGRLVIRNLAALQNAAS